MTTPKIIQQVRIVGGAGVGALKLASKVDGSPAIFADKSSLDTYTNIHTAWADELTADQSVALGVDDERIDYAYVRRESEWVDVVSNFKGEQGEQGEQGVQGEQGESVKIILVVNKREGQNLTTTVELDDGTSAESEPIDVAFIKSVAGQSPNESGEVQITPLNIGAYTTAETDAKINTATQQLESEIQTVEIQVNGNSTSISNLSNRIDEEFISAVLASVDKQNYAIDLRDTEKTAGYGKSGIISYFAAGPGNIEPNLDYGKWFFVHEKTDNVVGYHMLHKSLFPTEIQSKQSSFFTLAGTAKAALGKANQDASTTVDGAIWDSNGRLIPPTEDANNQTPAEFYNKDGEIVTEFSESLAGCYSYGAMSIIGPQLIYKGRLSSDGDDSTTVFTPDSNSDWFVFYGKAGGGTFNVKKLFMVFPRLYDDLSYITQTAAEGLGIKVSSNSEAIRELQENSQSDEESILEGIASGFIYAKTVRVG